MLSFALVSCRKATDLYFRRIPDWRCVKERAHFVKNRSSIWHNLKRKHVKKRLTYETGNVA